ncbi:MAG: diguanylate cyclase [Planctomycetes bacterium]|nr:diguanylate cyclase [Planctomycetota bacterium]
MESIRTLLVEDDIDDVGSIRAKLAVPGKAAFAVEHRSTLREAVSRARAGGLDVVLLDPDLPDASGIDSVGRLRAVAPDVPIVVVTDTEDEDAVDRRSHAGAEDFLVKRRTDRTLLERSVRRSLDRQVARIAMEQRLRALEKSEAGFRTLVMQSSEGLVVVSRSGSVLLANGAAEELVGASIGGLCGESLGFPFDASARKELAVRGDRVLEVQCVEGRWEQEPVWLVSLFDITNHKRAHAELEALTTRMCSLNASLEQLASIDPLTELLNRRGLAAELAIELRRKRRSDGPLAALLIDCDDFKQVNEHLGLAGGDAALKQLAAHLRESLRPSDHIGRIGGDEFLVLLPDTRFAEALQVAERLRLSISERPLRVASDALHVTLSLGIELLNDDVSSLDEVLLRTQASLRHSKHSGKNRVSTSDRRADAGAGDAEERIRCLLSGDGLRVLQRPVVRLDDETVAGAELVARGPAGIFEHPRDFLRLALEHNVLTPVDAVRLRACLEAARALPPGSRCHIDAMPSTLLETPVDELMAHFSANGGGLRFCLGISEQNIVGEPAALRDCVRDLKACGLRVSIDDIGFGRSSLETLILLEPDAVRIAPKFVRGVARDVGKARALRRMLAAVHSLGCEILADGIEARDDLELVRGLGVAYGQGRLWGEHDGSCGASAEFSRA